MCQHQAIKPTTLSWLMCFCPLHRQAPKCLTVFPTHLCVDGWPQAAPTDTSDCGTLAPKVPLGSKPPPCLSSCFSSSIFFSAPPWALGLTLPLHGSKRLLSSPLLSRRVAGAAVSDLPHWLGHRCEVGAVTWAPAGLGFPRQPGQTLGHQKVCTALTVTYTHWDLKDLLCVGLSRVPLQLSLSVAQAHELPLSTSNFRNLASEQENWIPVLLYFFRECRLSINRVNIKVWEGILFLPHAWK